MQDPPPIAGPRSQVGSYSLRQYRCVCGTSFEIKAAESQPCPSCGRQYHPGVFAETMNFFGEPTPPVSELPCEDDPVVGTMKGHFRIVSRLGAGGMGCVYQAIDESLQRYVALKVIRPRKESGDLLCDQLIQEARAQARVNHPNVVHIYYVGEADEAPFFAMELIPGRTLASRLEEGPLPFGSVIRIALQVASALERATQFDIVHGDIKPSNILEVDRDTVKISDFGLSRRLSHRLGRDGRLLGTPNYLSPESVRGDQVDGRSDIYSLGITLYELTFGTLPYQYRSSDLRERLEAHLAQTPRFPDPWPPSFPEAWRDVLTRMLAKDPAQRYASYGELMVDLRRLQPRRLIPGPTLSRAIAWAADAVPLTVLQSICVSPAVVLNTLESDTLWRWPANILGSLLSAIVLLGAIAVQCRWGVTPGKMVFNLAIVDRHGLRPKRRILILRFLFQFPWTALFFSVLLDALGIEILQNVVTAGIVLLLVVSAGFMAIRSDQRALHDWLLGTRVVVRD